MGMWGGPLACRELWQARGNICCDLVANRMLSLWPAVSFGRPEAHPTKAERPGGAGAF